MALAAPEEQAVTGNQLLHGIANAGIVVQALLLSMVALSVWNWFIILKKRKQFDEIAKENEEFLDDFWKASNLQQIHSQADKYAESPIARIFHSGYQEIERVVATKEEGLMLSGMENLERSLRKAHDDEVSRMEVHLGVLATTGSTAPFIDTPAAI